jgi:hypothetical protein
MASPLLGETGMKSRQRSSKARPPHEPPTLGPRRRPTKVRPLPPAAKGRDDYDPGIPPPRKKNPWVDEGEPEVNG